MDARGKSMPEMFCTEYELVLMLIVMRPVGMDPKKARDIKIHT